jgi:ABC-type branched-subunit amino acid transport system substrate-binding protein
VRSVRARVVAVATVVVAAPVVLVSCANVTVLTVSHSGDTDGVTATTIRVGAMGSFSGFAASDFAPVTTGAAVYFDRLNAAGGIYGRKIVYSPLVDDGTSPSGDTAAAQRLVQSKVFAVVGVGTPFFTGSSILRSQAVPTFGIQENTNAQWSGPAMFGAGGSYIAENLPMPQVAYVAQQTHSHSVAVLAYNVAQSSGGCISVVKALAKFHIHTPVVDFSIPYGAATLDADVTRMQQNGVDFVASCMDSTGDIKLSQTLQQHGMGSTVQYWLDGYDRRILTNNTAAYQGVYFLLQQTPFEVTAAEPGVYPGIDAFSAALRRYAPGTSPSGTALAGWVSADLFVQGLRAIGNDVTRTALVGAVNRLTAFTADGAYPPVNWTIAHRGVNDLDCTTYVRARATAFVPVFTTPASVYSCYDQTGRARTSSVTVTTLPLQPGVPGK